MTREEWAALWSLARVIVRHGIKFRDPAPHARLERAALDDAVDRVLGRRNFVPPHHDFLATRAEVHAASPMWARPWRLGWIDPAKVLAV